ncbi:ABC transporter permease [Sulfitobacter alexandrii]|uniref:ABC transporter permease n=1 Tax=Sulfitobacter alexandrii TaxID=1917485 RepID=A0A1J0WEA0_9RHOB|nr:ABC transporter permease [Sulfitobacter alexandrii]APE42486.1 ABC transporter permease [Sulfitobacter alexandrii]
MTGSWTIFLRNRAALCAFACLLLIAALAMGASLIYPQSPWKMVGAPFQAPLENGFLLGTDMLGRDIAAGLVYGARVSLMIGLISTGIALVIGIGIGAVAGYAGGLVDDLLMRLTEVFQTIPSLIFAIVLVAIMSPSINSIVLAISVVSWPPVARLVRAEFLSLRSREFVEASRVLGLPSWRIMLTDILPNAMAPVIVTATLMVATAILMESGLSFLGLGDPDMISWGYQIGAARTMLRTAWWMSFFPGVAIIITVLCLNLVGEGLSDALNPNLKRRKK